MDIILVPGLWLDASSWDEVTPALTAAGHRVHPLSMPGLGAPATASGDIGMAAWIDAVVERIDELTGRVVLVGHSGGGNVVWGAADARADRVARVVLVDSAPPAPGFGISEFDVVDGVVPFPGWDFFPDDDVSDLTPEIRERTAPMTHSVPGRVPTDPISLSGDRHRVPITMLMGSMDRSEFEAELENWPPFADEYRAIEDATVVRIGSGHWPQFSVPDRLAQLILDAVAESS